MRRWLVAGLLFGVACTKVPVVDIAAGFVRADAAWFEGEETLFYFYNVHAEQGLGPTSVIEITWQTDDERVDWTPLSELPSVHTHLPVDCGVEALCGSHSLHVPLQPRNVELRLRYGEGVQMLLDCFVHNFGVKRGF